MFAASNRRAFAPALAVSALALGLAACSTRATTEGLDPDEITSLYALVQTVDGVAFYPPLGPAVADATAPADTSLLAGMSVVLESTDGAGHVQTVATFSASTSPVLQLKPVHQVYFVNVPAAAYFTDASRAYRFRVLSAGQEIGRSDLSDRVFSVLASNPSLMVGVKVRVDQRAAPTLDSVTPASAVRGSSDLALTVRGRGFLHDSAVRFGAASLATTFVSASELVATVPASALAVAGDSAVQVVTPAPGGGASGSVTFTVQNPQPTLSALSPSMLVAGSANTVVTIDGGSFVAGALATLAGNPLTTTFVSATQLTVTVPAAQLAVPGLLALTVANPAPGVAASTSLTLTVRPTTPTLTSLAPSSVTSGSGATTLTVNGTGFNAGAVVSVASMDVATTFVSSTRLTAALSAATVATAGTVSVVATNPGPSALPSAPLTLTINNPTPILSTLAPTTVAAGSGTFTLTVNGTSFLAGASVTFGGTALTTTFVSSTRVTATVPGSLVSTYGTWNVTVTNPAPSAGASGAIAFSTSCGTGTHLEGASCVSDTRSCTITNGTGTQTWTGSAWGTCTATACDAGYTLSAGVCIVTSASLLVHLDAGNPLSYPGTGTTWYDLSGHNNNFTMFNGVGWNASGFMVLDGANDYIRSNGNLDFSAYDHILVEIWIRSHNQQSAMAFEHTPNWNTNTGGFGLAIHSGGFGTVVNQHHTNHNMGTVVRNYNATVGTGWAQHVNLFSRVADSTGRLTYVNGPRVPFVAVNGWSTSTSGSTAFTNAQLFLGSRAGTGSFLNGDIAIVRIYGVKLTDSQVQQNFDAQRGRYGL